MVVERAVESPSNEQARMSDQRCIIPARCVQSVAGASLANGTASRTAAFRRRDCHPYGAVPSHVEHRTQRSTIFTCGVETMTAPARGSLCPRLICASPVPARYSQQRPPHMRQADGREHKGAGSICLFTSVRQIKGQTKAAKTPPETSFANGAVITRCVAKGMRSWRHIDHQHVNLTNNAGI